MADTGDRPELNEQAFPTLQTAPHPTDNACLDSDLDLPAPPMSLDFMDEEVTTNTTTSPASTPTSTKLTAAAATTSATSSATASATATATSTATATAK